MSLTFGRAEHQPAARADGQGGAVGRRGAGVQEGHLQHRQHGDQERAAAGAGRGVQREGPQKVRHRLVACNFRCQERRVVVSFVSSILSFKFFVTECVLPKAMNFRCSLCC